MKAKVVTKEEIFKDNPTLCLSPLRFLDLCHKCTKVKQASRKGRQPKTLKCKPRMHKEFNRLIKEKKALLAQLKEIERKIEQLGG